MPRVAMRDVRKVDWRDKAAVIALAKRLGPGQIVIKRDMFDSYGITHASRYDLWEGKPGITIIFRT